MPHPLRPAQRVDYKFIRDGVKSRVSGGKVGFVNAPEVMAGGADQGTMGLISFRTNI